MVVIKALTMLFITLQTEPHTKVQKAHTLHATKRILFRLCNILLIDLHTTLQVDILVPHDEDKETEAQRAW